jgi:competence protein ComEA
MLARTLALGLVLGAVLVPSLLRNRAQSRRFCAPEGRGSPPRHWIGCSGDPGLPRDLLPDERLALGLAIDLNAADQRALAFVPGLSPRLARAVVERRIASGAFATVDDLLEVKGIGPRRLEKARPWLFVTQRQGAH